MLNPSIPGWIDKFFATQKYSKEITLVSLDVFYANLSATGFLYGHIISFDTNFEIALKDRLQSEKSKIALLNSLFKLFALKTKSIDIGLFLQKTIAFYIQINFEENTDNTKVASTANISLQLEKILDKRVQTNHDSIYKNFSHIITNSLLFIDVIAFDCFLEAYNLPEKYLHKFEKNLVSSISFALKVKLSPSNYDGLLIKLIESSLRYNKFTIENNATLENIDWQFFKTKLEKYYLINVMAMALWSDTVLENQEKYFLLKIAEKLHVSEQYTTETLQNTHSFFSQYKSEIPYFNYSNPVKHFYNQITQNVYTLVNRNRKRLLKEIIQSKDLMLLLAQSTSRELTEKEKKKVKLQLLDICKTIPSLTIFLLPGGSLLLPLLIKFIPKMLPTAFNENSEEVD